MIFLQRNENCTKPNVNKTKNEKLIKNIERKKNKRGCLKKERQKHRGEREYNTFGRKTKRYYGKFC